MSDNKKSSRAKRLKKSKKKKLIIGIAVVCILGGISVNRFNKKYIYNAEIANNIFIEKVDVSNMGKEEAIHTLNNRYVPKNINLTYEGKTYTISPSDIDLKYNIEEIVDYAYNYTKGDSYINNVKSVFSLKSNSLDLSIKSIYDEDKLNNVLSNISNSINVDMVNAKININNSGNISVIPSTTGKEMDIASNKEAIKKVIEDKVYGNLEVKVNIKEPKVSTKDAKLVNTLLAEYTTKFSGNNPARNHNIMLSAKKASDVILMPGEEFSYNTQTGMRTSNNGYKDAPVIVNNKLVDALGGGVCQTSSTMFNSVLTSGLKITYRTNHSVASNYVPLGQDAMVNDAGTDFRFKNPYDYPVYIKNIVTSNSITSRIYGNASSKQNITVKVENYKENGLDASRTYREYRDDSGKVLRTEYIGKSVYKKLEK